MKIQSYPGGVPITLMRQVIRRTNQSSPRSGTDRTSTTTAEYPHTPDPQLNLGLPLIVHAHILAGRQDFSFLVL